VRRDHHVVGSDRQAPCLQIGSDAAVDPRRGKVEIHALDLGREEIEPIMVLRFPSAAVRSVA